MLYRTIRNLVVVALIVSVLPLMRHYRLHYNRSTSAPTGLYRETNAPLTRGQYVLAGWPPQLNQVARERHFDLRTLPPLLKHIAALPGDHVTVSAEGVTINGRLWPNSKPLPSDHTGHPLTHWPFGEYIVAPGQVWLLSDSTHGFDSRYFGDVPLSLMVTNVTPVLTWR
jgi:conjugative transfer signal peptidase TraF